MSIARPASPPTDRVVAVVELLARAERPLSVADIAATLGLTRSTATAVLAALEAAGWAQRRPDRGYLIGPGLLGVAEAVRRRQPLAEAAGAELGELARRVGCGVALAHVGPAHLSFVAVGGDPAMFPPGIGVGTRVPMRPPAGAAAIAWREGDARAAWLAQAAPEARETLAGLLDLVRARGVAVWRTAHDQGPLAELLGEVAAALGEHGAHGPLRARVLRQLAPMARHPYTAGELTSDADLPLSFLSAPVFDADGHAVYELAMGPMRGAVPREERDVYIAELRAAADRMTALARAGRAAGP